MKWYTIVKKEHEFKDSKIDPREIYSAKDIKEIKIYTDEVIREVEFKFKK